MAADSLNADEVFARELSVRHFSQTLTELSSEILGDSAGDALLLAAFRAWQNRWGTDKAAAVAYVALAAIIRQDAKMQAAH